MIIDDSIYQDTPEEQEIIEDFLKYIENGEVCSFDVDEYLFLFDHFIDIPDFVMCGKVIRSAYIQYPDSLDIMDCEARLLAAQGKYSKALKICEKILKQDAFEPDYRLTYGKILLQTQKYEEANEVFEDLIDPSDPYLYGTLTEIGMAYESIFDLKQAEKFLLLASKESTENEEALIELGNIYALSEKSDKAEECYKKVLDKHPYASDVWHRLGEVRLASCQFDGATYAFDYAYTINPQDTDSLLLKGHSLFFSEKYKEASAVYEEYTDIMGEDGECCAYTAKCHEKLGETKQAIEAYRRTVELVPDDDHSMHNLALLLMEENPQEALKWISEAIKLSPKNGDYYLLRSRIYCETEKSPELPLKDAKKAYNLGRKESTVAAIIGSCYFELQEYKKAIPYLKIAAEDELTKNYIIDRLALAYMNTNDLKNMIEAISEMDDDKLKAISEIIPELKDSNFFNSSKIEE